MSDTETSRLQSRYNLQLWSVVIATVTEVNELFSYVILPEYGDQEAKLPHNELSNKRKRSLHKDVRPGLTMCVRVTRVSPEKGYVEVSKRQVEEGDRRKCHQRFARGKTIQSVIRRLGELMNMTSSKQLEDLNQRITWRLDQRHQTTTAAYDIFKEAYSNPDILNDLDLDTVTLDFLKQVISHRFALKYVKVRGDVDVMCFGVDGVDAIKHALNAGQKAAPAALPVEILVLAAPCYSVTCVALTNQREEAMASLQQAFGAIESTIGQYSGGCFRLHTQPAVHNEMPTSQTGA